jgi:hypothetical protein
MQEVITETIWATYYKSCPEGQVTKHIRRQSRPVPSPHEPATSGAKASTKLCFYSSEDFVDDHLSGKRYNIPAEELGEFIYRSHEDGSIIVMEDGLDA